MVVHQFKPDLKLGEIGERIVAAAMMGLPDWHFERRSNSREEQSLMGCDFLVRHGPHRVGFEVKTDMRAWHTKNLAVEVDHEFDDGTSKEGWAKLTTAKYIAFLIAPRHAIEVIAKRQPPSVERFDGARIMVVNVDQMRELLAKWRTKFAPRPARNATYKTWIIPVPLKVFAHEPGLVESDYQVWFRLDGLKGRIVAGASPAPGQGLLF